MATARFLQSPAPPNQLKKKSRVSWPLENTLNPSYENPNEIPEEHLKQHFDLEFFMSSTDVGLYKVAKEIFSYLDPTDLKNLRKVGRKNKTMDEFLNREQNFLWKKFEKVTLEIPKKIMKKKTAELFDPDGKTRRMLEDNFKVSVWVYQKNPGLFAIVSITGYLQGVMSAVHHVKDMFRDKIYYIEQFEEANSEILSSLDEKIKEKLEKATVKILAGNIEKSLCFWNSTKAQKSTTDIRKTLQEEFRVSVMINMDNSGLRTAFYSVTIIGDRQGVKRAIDKIKDMVHGCCDNCMEIFDKVNSEILLYLKEKKAIK